MAPVTPVAVRLGTQRVLHYNSFNYILPHSSELTHNASSHRERYREKSTEKKNQTISLRTNLEVMNSFDLSITTKHKGETERRARDAQGRVREKD